jgi:glycosyltransferase involved in cell wall biosynthesis
MITIAYFHDGTSVYDKMFLEHLTEKNKLYFLTFWPKPRFVPKKATTIVMREPLRQFTNKEWTEGIRMYALFLLRSLLTKIHIRQIKPQLVIGCMATKYGFYTTIARTKPTIVMVWGSDILIAPNRFLFFRFLAKHTLKKADAIILDSNIQKNTAVQLGSSQDKILKFPWFNTKEITPKETRNRIRLELNWETNIIVYCARNHEPIYHVQDLIEAIPQIIQKQPDTRFLILGEGSLTPMLKQRTRELGIRQHVIFTGAVSRQEAIDYLNASDVYVSTSLSDGTSASLLEAMTLGIPAVVTDIAGNKEWITNNENGILTPTQNPNTLAKKIIELIQNKETAKKLVQNAQKTIQQKVDWQKNMQTLDNLIEKLANKEA